MSTIRDQERDKGEGKGTRENQSGWILWKHVIYICENVTIKIFCTIYINKE
jgi:hypothetical protein